MSVIYEGIYEDQGKGEAWIPIMLPSGQFPSSMEDAHTARVKEPRWTMEIDTSIYHNGSKMGKSACDKIASGSFYLAPDKKKIPRGKSLVPRGSLGETFPVQLPTLITITEGRSYCIAAEIGLNEKDSWIFDSNFGILVAQQGHNVVSFENMLEVVLQSYEALYTAEAMEGALSFRLKCHAVPVRTQLHGQFGKKEKK